MARQLNRLPPRVLQTHTAPGRYADGGGLYLVVGSGASRKWVFRYRWSGRLTDMGLGAASGVSLARARELATDARDKLARGLNPLEAKRASQAVPTFGEMADAVVADLSPQWRNEKHRAQWKATLEKDAAKLRPRRVDQITTADVLDVLTPIWSKKPETAARLRGRIERVLDAAKAKGFRSGENPAAWRGHLSALPYGKVPAFLTELRQREAVAALALEFAIMTAARSGEARGATWGEMDLEQKVWTVPASRMKAGRDHRVPLSERAVSILEKVRPLADVDGFSADALVFPSANGKPLSDAAFDRLLQRMGRARGEVTPHGFRSSFRDWAGETTPYPREVAEAALAHVVGDQTERAYRRGDALEKRRAMMNAWARYCSNEPGESNLVALRINT